LETLQESRRIFSSLKEPALFAPTLESLGRVQFLLGQRSEGVATLRDSMEQYRELPEGERDAALIQRELDDLDNEQG
jgi:hypothetical protein